MKVLHLWLIFLSATVALLSVSPTISGAANQQAGPITSIDWSLDGTRIAGSNEHGQITIWNAETSEPINVFQGESGETFSIAWSPDSTQLVSGNGNGTVIIWDVATGNQLHVINPSGVNFRSPVMAVSWNSSYIAYGSASGDVGLWRVPSERRMGIYEHNGEVTSVAVAPNGEWVASTSVDGTLALIGTNTVFLVVENVSLAFSVDWTPDNGKVVLGGVFGLVQILDGETGQLLNEFGDSEYGVITSVAWSPNGNQIAATSTDGNLRVWNVLNQRILGTFSNVGIGDVQSVIWSPDGRQLAYGGADGMVQIVNVPIVCASNVWPDCD
jgi:WD40 repeat protein